MTLSFISRFRKTMRLSTWRRWNDASEKFTNGLHNGLALNPSKSDAVQLASARSTVNNVASVCVSGVTVQTAETIKSLGVIIDRRLSFDQHVNNVCKSCYFHIRALRHVRDSLPDDVARTVAISIVTSRLDYCNGLYYGMSSANLDKLQRVQNTLARVVLRLRRFDHITPALIELHWLPIRQRITFKLATITFKLVHTHRPSYLYELISDYQPTRELRSSGQRLLSDIITSTVTGSRAFKHSAVTVWNKHLPTNIRTCDNYCSFRRQLKTLLFRTAYDT